MSTYTKITKHPQTGEYELAAYLDDYFGQHIYGIEFKSDKKVYPTDMVESRQIYDFWKDDVVNAFCKIMSHVLEKDVYPTDDKVLDFLNRIQNEYKERWEKDPLTGNGATEYSKLVRDYERY